MRKEIHALLEGLWIWLLLVWGYIIIGVWLDPPSQYFSLALYFPFEETYVAGFSFVVSFFAFVLWRLTK